MGQEFVRWTDETRENERICRKEQSFAKKARGMRRPDNAYNSYQLSINPGEKRIRRVKGAEGKERNWGGTGWTLRKLKVRWRK
ncbi:hypothetical protein RUM44_008960 [Polyplax serrata]|uniref:Uncharacterized protein n=1 Tax=Polyplax serrata TaxID=468196 RepID=A0ABR1ARB9_POLSC